MLHAQCGLCPDSIHATGILLSCSSEAVGGAPKLDMCSCIARGVSRRLATILCHHLARSADSIQPSTRWLAFVGSRAHIHRASSQQQADKNGTENPCLPDDVEPNDPVVQRLFGGLIEGRRAMLAESITLIESTHPLKQARAQLLLTKLLEHGKSAHKNTSSFRIGEDVFSYFCYLQLILVSCRVNISCMVTYYNSKY